MLNNIEIQKILPHRYPFFLGDKIVEMEEGKNITAKSIAYSRGKMWFECYDTDNNEYYGWVSDENVAFYECEGTKGTSYQSVNSPVYGEIK